MRSTPVPANECRFKFLEKRQVWDCTDGVVHGGGRTREEAYEDYCQAVSDEFYESTVGFQG